MVGSPSEGSPSKTLAPNVVKTGGGKSANQKGLYSKVNPLPFNSAWKRWLSDKMLISADTPNVRTLSGCQLYSRKYVACTG